MKRNAEEYAELDWMGVFLAARRSKNFAKKEEGFVLGDSIFCGLF
jgi:hypothetical protein